jgi:hypothetical protein
MLLITPPALIFLKQAAVEKAGDITRVTYELLHVSPTYFMLNMLRPQGVQTILPDDAKSTITVTATLAGHAELKKLLARVDVEPKPPTIEKKLPAFSEVRIQTKVEGEVELLPYPAIAILKDATAEIGVWTADQLAGYLKSQRPFNYVMVSFDYFLRVTPHFSPDEKTARLEYFLLQKQKPKDSLISLGTQTVTVGVNTKMSFQGTPAFTEKQEFFVRIKRVTPDDTLLLRR